MCNLTLHQAVLILDLFISTKYELNHIDLHYNEINLYSICALFISSKYYESDERAPTSGQIMKYMNREERPGKSSIELLGVEREVLNLI